MLKRLSIAHIFELNNQPCLPSYLPVNRRTFVEYTTVLAAGLALPSVAFTAAAPAFPVVRPAAGQRRFRSRAVEAAIAEFKKNVKDPELSWLFENCFPSTLDTTVTHSQREERPDTYALPVISMPCGCATPQPRCGPTFSSSTAMRRSSSWWPA